MVITELGVFTIDDHGMKLIELAPGVALQEVEEKTEATFETASSIKGKAA